MSERSTQLLLELLLIRERYSDQDLRAISELLTAGRMSHEIGLILEMVDEVAKVRRSRSKKPAPQKLAPNEAKVALLSELNKRKSAAVDKRLEAVAKRLGLESRDSGRERLLRQVEARLNEMSDRELAAFLKPYRLKAPTDEGYIGLANYLIHNR